MSDPVGHLRQRSSRRATMGAFTCPACGGILQSDAKWCPSCNFTGGDSVAMFPESPPPLLPILDVAGLLSDQEIGKIEAARETLRRRFPQFHWRVCSVALPRNTSLPVFGFWLLNACALQRGETREDRTWTVLLLIDATKGQAAVIPGYSAEPFIATQEWRSILEKMSPSWQAGKLGEAVVEFFQHSRTLLERAWKCRDDPKILKRS